MKSTDISKISFDQLCDVIDLLSPSMDDYLYVCDFPNDLYYISKMAVQRFALPSNTFQDVVNTHEQFVYWEDFPALQKELNELTSTDRSVHNMMYRWVSRKGSPVWINCRGRVVRNGDGSPKYLIGCINEIGLRQKADNVSGLLGEASMRVFIEGVSNVRPEGFLLRVGLDGLKGINARLGVEYGDMLIRKTAEIIHETLSPGQKLYHVTGDEYIILDFLGGTAEDAKSLYNRIRVSIENFIIDSNYEVVFTISGGIVVCGDVKNLTYSNLIKLTEFALNTAKNSGRNRCSVFTQEHYEQFIRKRRLVRQLRRSVKNNFEGFEAYYQPIVKASAGKIYGAETLIRFHSHTFGLVSPAEFIPILEETGLIIPVGKWILYEALHTCRQINQTLPDFHININLSTVQVMKSDVGGDIIFAVKAFGVTPSNIVIELTESDELESDKRFSKMWSDLKTIGIKVALDDFGSGYSNFRYLTSLDPDILKIDRLFTVQAMKKDFEYKLLMLLCELAHSLNLNICIEGIETEKELAAVKSFLPEFIQGYYYGKPCPLDEFLKLLPALLEKQQA